MSQVQLAQELEISPSYLNLIEHNQRPVTAYVIQGLPIGIVAKVAPGIVR